MAKLRYRKIRRYAVWAFYMYEGRAEAIRCLDVYHCTFKAIKRCIDKSVYIGFLNYLPLHLQGVDWDEIGVQVRNMDNNSAIVYRKKFINQ